jgi:hypothetical protein
MHRLCNFSRASTALLVVSFATLTLSSSLGCESCLDSGETCIEDKDCCDEYVCEEFGSGRICQ